MRKTSSDAGRAKILDAWRPPAHAGEPIGCFATTFTFSSIFFEEECLGRFLSLESDAEDDKLQFVIEQQERMAQLTAAVALVDQRHCEGKRSLRWDLLPARLRGRFMHAKVSLLAWQNTVRLIIGSANLTEDGYRRNQEVFGQVDYHEDCEAPRDLLEQVLNFLRRLIAESVVGADQSPAVARSRRLLTQVEEMSAGWGVTPELARRAPIRLFPVLSGLGEPGVLDQLWPIQRPPSSAYVVSPFFDPGAKLDGPTAKLWTIMRQRGEAKVVFCVDTEPIPGSDKLLAHAPDSLYGSEPKGRPSVSTSFHQVIDPDHRPLHTKAIWLEDGERFGVYMIGSSNFTSAGLNFSGKGNVEANLVYLFDRQQYRAEVKLLDAAFPTTELLDRAKIQWRSGIGEEEESPSETSSLPVEFGRAVFDCSSAPHGKLTLHFRGRPNAEWTVTSEDETRLRDSSEVGEVMEGSVIEIPWPSPKPPSGVWVYWSKQLGRSWWPVEVLSPDALLPPEEMRNLPLDILIRILTSAQPLHRILAAEVRRQEEAKSRLDAAFLTDPHKKVDVSAFLLQRSRRMAAAIDALCDRLTRATPNEACLHWKLQGPVGLQAVVEALHRESRSAEERAFLMTEVALALARVEPESAPGSLEPVRVKSAIRVEIEKIQGLLPAGDLTGVPQLRDYVERAFEEIRL